jgi:hypothetical protein
VRGEAFREQPLDDLARRVARKLVHDDELARRARSEVLAGVAHELRGSAPPGACSSTAAAGMSPWIGERIANAAAVLTRRMRLEHALDLGGKDVDAVEAHHVVAPPRKRSTPAAVIAPTSRG